MHKLDDFLLKREDLAFKISKLTGILGRIGLHQRSATLTKLEEDCQNSDFRILIAGEFKRGKSCLVNALLKSSILPMKVAPCTTTVTEVRYGERQTARIHTNQGIQQVDFNDRFRYCTIQGQQTLPDEQKPIHKVQLTHPSAIAKNGLTLIDSPGLNEDWTRTQASLKEIVQADVILLVLSSEMALSQSELQFIQSHLLPYRKHLFFVWNRADAIWDKPEEQAALQKRSDQHLLPHSSHIHFVSAREGLLGALQSDDARWTKSKIPDLIESMESFLAEDRVSAKLKTLCQQTLQTSSYTLFQVIPRMSYLLSQTPTTWDRFFKAVSELATVETERTNTIKELLNTATTDLLAQITNAWDSFVESLPEQLMQERTTLSFEPRISRQEREDIIIDWFSQRLQNFLHTFTQETLKSQLETTIEDLKIKLDQIRIEHLKAVEEAIEYDSDEIQLLSGRWVEETSILISTTLSLTLLKIDRDHIESDLLKVRALRGWLMGATLSEGDLSKLTTQLQKTLRSAQETLLAAHKTHLSSTMLELQDAIVHDVKLTRQDVLQQIDTVLKQHDNSKQDTTVEQQALQLETLRLSVHNLHTQLRTLHNTL